MAKKQKQDEDAPLVFDLDLDDATFSGMISRRAAEAKAHWNKEYNLDKIRESNKELYTAKYIEKMLRDERYEEVVNDNNIFKAVRTILPFITSNITKPEITPSNSDSLSLQFAKDFEKILVEQAEDEYTRDKVKLALQDLLMGQRVGVLKQVYDSANKKWCVEHLDPSSVIIGKRARLRDELDFIQHTQERSIGDLIQQFENKKSEIFKLYDIQKGTPRQLEEVVKITENWLFVDTENGKKLGIGWKAEKSENSVLLGKTTDPNWMDSGRNVINQHMMPFIFFNILNDGSGYIDHTSFIEQAEASQKQYNKRGTTIAENAAYGGTGVPVFGKGAIKQETAARVQFSPKQRILLDVEDVGKGFTTWTSGNLPNFIMEDKIAQGQAVLDAFGTNGIQAGQESDSKTLGQDVLSRNQAEGRQQEFIDCADNGMLRFFQLQAQLTYRYIDEEQSYNLLGDDGQFEHLVISQEKIAKNLGIKIKVKAGSSLPVDRSQKIAQAVKLMENKRIGTLRLYKELGVENPEEAYKEYLREMLNPAGEIAEMDDQIYSREADEDLQLVIGGKQPDEREDITEDYIQHLNDFLMTQRYEQLPEAAQQRVSQYVADIVAQAQRKLLKMMTQEPIQPPAPAVGPDGAPLPPQDPGMQSPAPDATMTAPVDTAQAIPMGAPAAPMAI